MRRRHTFRRHFMRQFEGNNDPHFLRRHRGRINTIITLAMINLFTGVMGHDFWPWFLIPSFFIALPIIQDIVNNTLWGEDNEDTAEPNPLEDDHQTTTPPTSQPLASEPDTGQKDTFSPAIQAHLNKARAYKEQIEAYIQATTDPHSRERLQDLSNQIKEWAETIEVMARQVNNFQQNPVILQDLAGVPQSIENLEAQLAGETNEAIRAELERTLTSRKHQLAALKRLQNMMKQAEIKMESTLASLGTIYSQLLASQSTNQAADYNHLSADVNEEVHKLQDYLDAMEEVKLNRG